MKRAFGVSISIFACIAIASGLFQNCSPVKMNAPTGTSAISSSAAAADAQGGNGNGYEGKTYVNTGACGTDVSAAKARIQFSRDGRSAVLVRENCTDTPSPLAISSSEIVLFPFSSAFLLFHGRVFDLESPTEQRVTTALCEDKINSRFSSVFNLRSAAADFIGESFQMSISSGVTSVQKYGPVALKMSSAGALVNFNSGTMQSASGYFSLIADPLNSKSEFSFNFAPTGSLASTSGVFCYSQENPARITPLTVSSPVNGGNYTGNPYLSGSCIDGSQVRVAWQGRVYAVGCVGGLFTGSIMPVSSGGIMNIPITVSSWLPGMLPKIQTITIQWQ